MALKLSDLVILSDIDGTLVHAPNPISKRNVEAITRFTQKGGRFALASGRPIESTRPYVDQLPINAPCILINGGILYDYNREEMLYAKYLPDTYKFYAKTFLEAFPHVGGIVHAQKTMHSIARYDQVSQLPGTRSLPVEDCSIDALSGDFFKMLFTLDEEDVDLALAFWNEKNWDDIEITRSNPRFIEIIPKGISKAVGVQNLAKHLGVDTQQIVCIGDYYNDVEMLKASGFAATVEDAPDEVKSICNLVVGKCELGAIADLIEYLEQRLS